MPNAQLPTTNYQLPITNLQQREKMKIKRIRYNKKVKRLLYSLLVCLAFVLVNLDFSSAMAQQVTPGKYTPKHYTDLEFKPVGEIKLPE